ncbi:MAG: JAB domain-containing protein [Verrucomicrobiota bacterium]
MTAIQQVTIDHSRQYVPELKAVCVRQTTLPVIKVGGPEDVANAWRTVVETALWYDADKEHLAVFLLDAGGWLKAMALVSTGTVDHCLAHAREIYRPAIACSASAVIMAHNHCSGELEPSIEDIRATKRMVTAGHLLDIPCLDHIVIGRNRDQTAAGFLSMKESMLIDFPS